MQTSEASWNPVGDNYMHYSYYDGVTGNIRGQDITIADQWSPWVPKVLFEAMVTAANMTERPALLTPVAVSRDHGYDGDHGDDGDRGDHRHTDNTKTTDAVESEATPITFIKQNYKATTDTELTVKEGDAVYIGQQDPSGWTHVRLAYIGNRTVLKGWIPGWSLRAAAAAVSEMMPMT